MNIYLNCLMIISLFVSFNIKRSGLLKALGSTLTLIRKMSTKILDFDYLLFIQFLKLERSGLLKALGSTVTLIRTISKKMYSDFLMI